MDFEKINNRYKKISYHRQPDDFTAEEWQYALRKQFAESHPFRVEKQGKHKVFTDYTVLNPETKLSYKVALRSSDNSANFCECNDFKTNGLGTCNILRPYSIIYAINYTKERCSISLFIRIIHRFT